MRMLVLPTKAALITSLLLSASFGLSAFAASDNDLPQSKEQISTITEDTPSRAQYFSWINNTNEGATEAQTLTNLEFFEWLKSEYGMQLDIYAFDAGAIDSKRWYGSTTSPKFKRQFPNGFDPIYEKTKTMGVRLGVWGGPDGFGDTKAEEEARTRMMVDLCDRYNFALFKFDSVAGNLRTSKQKAFARMMSECRSYTPDLILLNHRLNLGEIAKHHATTFLWEGLETYIDVHMVNSTPAPHHRAGALARGLPPKLSRLTEDHGVCLSSALDHWDDELILQAFNRSLILSPQIYCNPWLLSDEEFPKLARIFNLARQYRNLLPNGIILPEAQYGPSAVSRGDATTRLITLRNLSWQTKTFQISLNQEIGLEPTQKLIEVRKYHPNETIFGHYSFNSSVDIQVPPFRSSLIKVSSKHEFGLKGVEYNIIKDVEGQPIEIELTGEPGSQAEIQVLGLSQDSFTIDDQTLRKSDTDGKHAIHFDGKQYQQDFHRKLGDMKAVPLPIDAETLYEATVYSADNNALELRSLDRSGPTDHPQVKAARDAFFNQQLFIDHAISDRNLFDGDNSTAFAVMNRWQYWWNEDPDARINDGGFRLDFGKIEYIDQITLETRDITTMQPAKIGEGIIGEVSTDLKTWTEVRFVADRVMDIKMPHQDFPVRYFRIKVDAPNWLSEVNAYKSNSALDRSLWRASNLFGAYERMDFKHAWSLKTQLTEITPQSYLAVAIPGDTGNEGVYAALRVNDKIIGAPDRAPSYPANTWELQVKPVSGNYTYYIPLKKEWENKKLEIIVLGGVDAKAVKPYVWLTREPIPLAQKKLIVSN